MQLHLSVLSYHTRSSRTLSVAFLADLLYEEELLRNPYSLKMWWRYLEARRGAAARKRYILYERALRALPVSYKVKG